jgi:hypothetical protein
MYLTRYVLNRGQRALCGLRVIYPAVVCVCACVYVCVCVPLKPEKYHLFLPVSCMPVLAMTPGNVFGRLSHEGRDARSRAIIGTNLLRETTPTENPTSYKASSLVLEKSTC